MKQQGIHYFPGHMQKALRNLGPYVKMVDLIIEILDARAPLSSRNPLLDELAGGKARLLLLSKSDYADPQATERWLAYFRAQGLNAIAGNLKKDKLLSLLSSACSKILKSKREKEQKIGMKKQAIRVLVMGVPNVGKSTFINNLKGEKIAIVGNKAGVTRAPQWIKLSDDYVLLDSPGVLPMNYADPEQATRLALLGTMREEVLPSEELANYLLDYFKKHYTGALNNRFGLADITSMNNEAILLEIAAKRGLLEGGKASLSKASYLLVKEYKDGLLGRFSLETPQC